MKKIVIYMLGMASISFTTFAQTLSLQKSKQLAVLNNKKVKNSELEIAAAQEVKMEAYTNYFPKISASAKGMQAIDPLLKIKMQGGNLPVYDGNTINLANATQFAYMPDVSIGIFNQMALGSLDLVQPIYAGGKIGTGNKLAQLNVEVKQKQLKMSENDVLLRTEQQYWQVIAIREKQKTLDNYEGFLSSLYKQVNDAYNAGMIIQNDLLKVKISQSELKVNKTKLENGKKLALMQLCQTIGIDYNPGIVLDDKLEEPSLPDSYYVSNKSSMPGRVEFQLLEKAIKATELESKLKKGDYLPEFAVGASGYYLDQFEKNTNGSLNGMVYASLSVPISDWWGGKHKLKELKIKQQVARNNMDDTQGLLNLQMEKGWTDLKQAHERVLLIAEMLVQTRENLKVNQDSYNNGIVQLSDLLEAQAQKVETEDRFTEAEMQYKTAITNYLQVTGR